MKLKNLLIGSIIGITCLSSSSKAEQIGYNPIANPYRAPKEPKKDNYLDMQAILNPKDEILERIEIKYK